ncbi:MAG: endonuclease/exonuclease/phosphatase family protein [Ruminococcus sp.]|nr:endonuclease/exonuclease/phosphatase family protein [Ruminococcus sp.]MCD7800056.1 endonuclease/exonuclease/phosphatase family protein [Ruminococcus sp.]
MLHINNNYFDWSCCYIKILTLNTHSLIEDAYSKKLEEFVHTVALERPDVISLQEVNQSVDSNPLEITSLEGYFPCDNNISIHEDNHVYNVAKRLQSLGILYYWTWLPIKVGYVKFTEGLAILSLKPILKTDTLLISNTNEYYNWRTRKVLGITIDNKEWFYNTHMSWWNDAFEPFQLQWLKLNNHLKSIDKVWLMGDFNNPASIESEGYDMVSNSKWFDTYILAKHKDTGFTVENLIDGWKERLPKATGMRIDQIWCNQEVSIESSRVIFNGKGSPIVSDHYGVIISTL